MTGFEPYLHSENARFIGSGFAIRVIEKKGGIQGREINGYRIVTVKLSFLNYAKISIVKGEGEARGI